MLCLIDFLENNCKKVTEHSREMMHFPIDHWMKDLIKSACESFCENYIFKTNFESYFDDQAPFQLSEAILTGCMNEGLSLISRSTKAPDMDFFAC